MKATLLAMLLFGTAAASLLYIGPGARRRAAASVPAVWEALPSKASDGGECVARFDWSMPPRFGIDANHDGRLDVPNSTEYVCPAGYTVRLDATGSAVPGGAVRFRWELEGADGRRTFEGAEPVCEVSGLRLHRYRVHLTVTGGGGVSAEATGVVTPHDVVIAVMGDSYAAGEGAPEVRRDAAGGRPNPVWADSPDAAARHFSARCAAAQAALALERADPKSSVTFVSVASSGATIDTGILGRQAGKAPVNTSDGNLSPQIDQLKGILGGRGIDILIIGVGGNDAGFVPTIRDLVKHDSHPFADDVADIADRVAGQLGALDRKFDRLAGALSGSGIHVGRVLLTTYPDPFTGPGTSTMLPHDILEDAADSDLEWLGVSWNLPTASLSPGEMRDARKIFIRPLNALLRQVAARHGWIVVPMDAALAGHGYSDDPDAHGQRWNWVTTFHDSLTGQASIDGTMHPNAEGYEAMAKILEPLLTDAATKRATASR